MKDYDNNKNKKQAAGRRFAIPFFVVLAVLTIIAFIIPLRPSVSYAEKRELAKFPEFSWDALISGSYFDDISFWFSDTFPGREAWLQMYDRVEELHGKSDIALGGELVTTDSIPDSQDAAASETASPAPSDSPEPSAEPEEETAKAGIELEPNAEILFGSVIQINDTVYHYFGFNKLWSDRFIDCVNNFADAVADEDVRVITCLIPSSVGILFDKEYMEKLQCADQEAAIDYISDGLNDSVIPVDMYDKLLAHRDEYLFFRTDHHWTALGAYYGYASLCETLGMEAAPLSSFEEMDQGTYIGSLFWNAPNSSKLKKDNLYAYCPPGDITMSITDSSGYSFEAPLILDKTNDDPNTKYVSFLTGDHPLCTIVNNDIKDDSSCVIIKDSFGNPVAPYLTQNYHTVYAIDFRTYRQFLLQDFVKEYDVDDVIFMPALGMVQEAGAISSFNYICQTH